MALIGRNGVKTYAMLCAYTAQLPVPPIAAIPPIMLWIEMRSFKI